ncbi:KH domain-containing protein akap-1-like isoform X2 [Atheta coriaria]|uniref:KH domain-containing protein akap-1-like isoform X2 n=1 Tax=Dalotia coriaria TaxID=877792 RepID=UPI0031F3B6F1
MAPSYSRQLLVFAVPTIAVLLTYFWFKRKRGVKQSDPGDSPSIAETKLTSNKTSELQEVSNTPTKSIATPSGGNIDRSPRVLSTPSTPIDIIIPRELRSQRTSPIVISDEDLDIEIEKVKSMRSYSSEHYKLSGGSDTIDGISTTSSTSSRTPAKKAKAKVQQPEDAMPAGKLDSQVKSKNQMKTNAEKKKGKMTPVKKVEEELSNMKLNQESETQEEVKVENGRKEEQANAHAEERQSSERDSANHSPADVMLASPSLSCISDNHSEGSSDSGKGGSDVATPPSRTPAGDSMPLTYEFTLPQVLVGKLIGRFGTFVAEIKEKTRSHIVIKKHPTVGKLKLCVIEGSQSEIDKALKMIRERFPLKKHPEVTLEQVTVSTQMSSVPISTDHIYLKLVEGVNNDTIVSCMVTPSHLFLQQPTHPSYPHLQVLSRYMMMCYSNPESPSMPKPIQPNTICVAESIGEWCRAMILSTSEEEDTSYVTFLDYGGFAVIPNDQLKQIRGDFLLLPFQAAECHLANIRPVGGDDAQWCDEAYKMVADVTKGALALAQIAEYTEHGIPLVLMYILVGPQSIVYLNDELVKRGFAEYIHTPEILDEVQTTYVDVAEPEAGAVGGIAV